MNYTIASAITNSNSDLAFCDCYRTIRRMADKIPLTEQALKLKALVDQAGGLVPFAEKYSHDIENDPINATYVSQIINGTRAFGDKSRRNMASRAGLPANYFEVGYSANEAEPLVYVEPAIPFMAADEIEVVTIMRTIDSEARRNILAAARLAATEFRLRQENSTKRAGQ